MANIAFKKGLLANLPSTHAEGTFYVTTDERAIYLDISDSARIRLGDFQEFATVAALEANTNPNTTALYYVADINCLAKWDGSKYVQINLDTGATSVEVTGTGNAVTAASYDAATRKLTLTMGETFATAAELSAADEAIRDYVDEKTQGIATDAALGELQADVDELEKVSHSHENADVLNGISAEKVAAWDAAEQNAKDYADGLADNYDAAGAAAAVQGETASTVKSVEDALNTYKTENDAAVAAAKKAGEDAAAAEAEIARAAEQANAQAAANAMAEAQAKVASVGAGDGSVTVAGTATAPTVAVKLDPAADNALKLNESGLKVEIGAAPEYSIVKAAESGDYAAIYNLTKDGVVVGASINIPKDMVVKSGSVDADGNIVLVLNDEANTEIVIDASTLIEYVTSGSVSGDMVVINVSDDHKVTASITDGSITAAKLTTELQTAIGKAHSHENAAVLAGITEQNIVDWNDAVAKEHEHANKTELDKIADGDKAKWDTAATDAAAIKADYLKASDKEELAGDIADAQAAAEQKATELNGAMDTRVKALEAIDHDAYKAYADQAETDAIAAAKTYTDGLAGNYDAAGAAATAESNAKAYADGLVLAWGTF